MLTEASPNIDITTDAGSMNFWRFLASGMTLMMGLIGLALFVFKKVTGGGAMLNMGKAKARQRTKDSLQITFDAVGDPPAG